MSSDEDERAFVNELAKLRQARFEVQHQRASLPDIQPVQLDFIDETVREAKRDSQAKIDTLKAQAEATAKRLEELQGLPIEPPSYSHATQELSALIAQISCDLTSSDCRAEENEFRPVNVPIAKKPQLRAESFRVSGNPEFAKLSVQQSLRPVVLSPTHSKPREYRAAPPAEFIPEGEFGVIARLAESSRREEISAFDLPESHSLRVARETHVKRLIELQATLEEALVRKTISELSVSVARAKKEVQDLLGVEQAASFTMGKHEAEMQTASPVVHSTPSLSSAAEVVEAASEPAAQDDVFLYFDFALGLPNKFSNCRVAYAFSDSGAVITSVKATASETQTSPGVFAFRAVRLVDQIAPIPKLRLVVELQAVKNGAGVTSIGWTMFELFDSAGSLRVGKWKSAVFAPPPQLAAKTAAEMGTPVGDGAFMFVRIGRGATHVRDVKEGVDAARHADDYVLSGFDKGEPVAAPAERERVSVQFRVSAGLNGAQSEALDLTMATVQAEVRDAKGEVFYSAVQPEEIELPLDKQCATVHVRVKARDAQSLGQPVTVSTEFTYKVTDGYRRLADLTWTREGGQASSADNLVVELGERPAESERPPTAKVAVTRSSSSVTAERTPAGPAPATTSQATLPEIAEEANSLFRSHKNPSRPKKGEVFEPKLDGVDVYVDGVRFPPEVALASRVKVKIASGSFETVLTKEAAFCTTKTDAEISEVEHRIRDKLEYRDNALTDPTAELHFRLECIDRSSKEGSVCTYGFARLPLFRKPDGSYNVRASDNVFCLNNGAWQVPVTVRPNTQTRLPLCTLLLRVAYAPKTAGMRVMSKADFPEEDWKDLGLWVEAKTYEEAQYDTSLVGELTSEERDLLARRSPDESEGETETLLEALTRYRRERALADLNRKDLEQWYLSRFESFSSNTPAPPLELGRLVTYSQAAGLQFSIDRVHRVNADLPVVCLVTPVPPLNFYSTPRTSDETVATMEIAFDSPLRSQRFPEHWWSLKPEYGANAGVVVEIVAVDARKQKIKPLGWTFVSLFDAQKLSAKCGHFAAPVVQGAVDVELVKAIAMQPSTKVVNAWQVIDGWSSKTKRDAELTLYCKSFDAQLGKEFLDGVAVQQTAALRAIQAYEPREFEGAKKLLDVKPREFSAMEWERAVRKLVVAQYSLDKYKSISS